MDRQQLTSEKARELEKRFKSYLHTSDISKIVFSNRVNLKKPKTSVADEVYEIFKQRRRHKNIILFFLIALLTLVAVSFFGLVYWNAYSLQSTYGDVEVVNQVTLQIIAVSFFVQLIAVVGFITKALWDDKGFLATPIIKNIHREKRDE